MHNVFGNVTIAMLTVPNNWQHKFSKSILYKRFCFICVTNNLTFVTIYHKLRHYLGNKVTRPILVSTLQYLVHAQNCKGNTMGSNAFQRRILNIKCTSIFTRQSFKVEYFIKMSIHGQLTQKILDSVTHWPLTEISNLIILLIIENIHSSKVKKKQMKIKNAVSEMNSTICGETRATVYVLCPVCAPCKNDKR